MQINTRPITLFGIAKLAILGIFFNYYCYNILRGSLIPGGSAVFYIIAIAGVTATLFNEKNSISSEIYCWLVYVVLSLFFSGFAIDSAIALRGIGDFVRRLLLIVMIAYICEKEKSIKYAIRLLAIVAVLCGISVLLTTNQAVNRMVIETGASISTNDIGSIMAFGCFAILFVFGKSNNIAIKTLIKIGYIIVAISVIFIAGSRKSILAILILFVCIFLFCGRNLFSHISTLRFVIVLLLLIGAALFVYLYLLPQVEQTTLYARVFGNRAEGTAQSDEGRIKLYVNALVDFSEKPLIGLGFNNFVVVHSLYTHSTYVEPLACSGIMGFLYLSPYVMILFKQIRLIKFNKYHLEERIWQKELLAFYISFLFVGIGIPYMYKDIPCIILAMFIASQKISFDKLKERETVSVSEGVPSESKTDQSFAGAV